MNGRGHNQTDIPGALSVEAVLAALKAAGESTRLRVLHLLALGELNVKDLTTILGQSQPRISRHLKLLAEAGLINRHREGNWVYCRITDDRRLAELIRDTLKRVREDEPVLAGDRTRLEAIKADRAAEAERFFNTVADEWDRVRALQIGEVEVERAILDLAGGRRYRTMFDLGTGTGRMLELFADRIDRGVGIDLSPTMLTHARIKLERAGHSHCQLRHGDITQLMQNDRVADLVVLHQVLHYFDDPIVVLREAARLLAPDGRFVIADFAPHSLEFLREEYAHRRLGFSREQMTAWLAEAGLDIADSVDLAANHQDGRSGLTVSIWLAGHSAQGIGRGGGEQEIAA